MCLAVDKAHMQCEGLGMEISLNTESEKCPTKRSPYHKKAHNIWWSVRTECCLNYNQSNWYCFFLHVVAA